jgi:hypothetical protein
VRLFHSFILKLNIKANFSWGYEAVGLLLPLQFLPKFRETRPRVHRWLGRLLILGVSLGNIGGMMATRRSFGGTLTAQVSFGTLVVISSFSLWKAWMGIRERRIDRHRVWMLRAWSYVCSVSTIISEEFQRKRKALMRKGLDAPDTHGHVFLLNHPHLAQ